MSKRAIFSHSRIPRRIKVLSEPSSPYYPSLAYLHLLLFLSFFRRRLHQRQNQDHLSYLLSPSLDLCNPPAVVEEDHLVDLLVPGEGRLRFLAGHHLLGEEEVRRMKMEGRRVESGDLEYHLHRVVVEVDDRSRRGLVRIVVVEEEEGRDHVPGSESFDGG